MGLIPKSGRSSGEGSGNPFQYSCLENCMDRGAWQATVHGVTKSWTQLKQLNMQAQHMFYFVFDNLLLIFSFKCLLVLENVSKPKKKKKKKDSSRSYQIRNICHYLGMVLSGRQMCLYPSNSKHIPLGKCIGGKVCWYIGPIVRMFHCELSIL